MYVQRSLLVRDAWGIPQLFFLSMKFDIGSILRIADMRHSKLGERSDGQTRQKKTTSLKLSHTLPSILLIFNHDLAILAQLSSLDVREQVEVQNDLILGKTFIVDPEDASSFNRELYWDRIKLYSACIRSCSHRATVIHSL